MSFGFGFGFPSWRTLAGGFSPAALFVGGVQGAWYDPSDLSTLFDSSTGTTPVSMPGQGAAVPVGAMLDKRAAGYSVFFDGTGDYLTLTGTAIGSGDFTVEGWVYPTAAGSQIYFDCRNTDLDANGFAFYRSGTSFAIYTNGAATSGGTVSDNVWTHLAFVRSAGTITAYINGTQAFTLATSANFSRTAQVIGAGWSFGAPVTGYMSNVRVVVGTAVYTSAFTPPTAPLSPISGTSLLTCGVTWAGNPAITTVGNTRVDGLNPFTASPVGNHAISFNNLTARPELRARVNLLTYSEEFDNGAWSKVTVSAANTTATTDPLGGNTADKLIPTAASGNHNTYNTQVTGLGAAGYVVSIYAKAAEYSWLVINTYDGADRNNFFDLANGTLGTVASGNTASITAVGNGWYRCVVNRASWSNTPPNTTNLLFGVAFANNTTSFTGDGTSGIYIWGADLRPANIGANVPAYQRIADANTYDTNGFPLYLFFTTDDSMYTPANLDLSGTDKVSVFAGVRQVAAGNQQLVELSADVNTNNGAFSMPKDAVAPAVWTAGLRGTTATSASSSAIYAAPITTVNTGLYDIALSADEVKLRINGAQVATSGAGSAGTGNFGTYPLYIGSRANTTVFFNGHLHGLIIAGSAVSAGNISATEQWVAGKTGIQI